MELFVVNRYHGESSEPNDTVKPRDGLEKLLEKIEERKRLRLHENLENKTGPYHEELKDNKEDEHRRKKSKKRKRELNDSEEQKNEFDDNIEIKASKKHKTKQYAEDVDDIGTDEQVSKSLCSDEQNIDFIPEEIPEQDSIIPKRKDKRKKRLNDSKDKGTEQDDSVQNDENKISKKKQLEHRDSSGTNQNSLEDVNGEISTNNTLVDGNDESEFTVIGGHNFKQKSSVKWVLPEWLANSILITGSFRDKKAKVKHLQGLDKDIRQNLKKNKIKYFFPVQQTVIPWLLKETTFYRPGLRFWPRDVCVCTPTGSGKTLAYVVPIIQHLKNNMFIRRIQALVVVPVQDLAAQVARVFRQYAVGTGLRVLSVMGKATPLQQEQKNLVYYRTGYGYVSQIDIMVTTPGRLVEHIKETPGFSLQHLKFLVIDEADRVIDIIKNDWLYHLENHISSGGIGVIPPLSLNTLSENPLRPQKLLFSATLTQDPEKLKQVNLFQPRMFVAKTSVNDKHHTGKLNDTQNSKTKKLLKPVELEEQWIKCNAQLKPLIFYHILVSKSWRGVLCFTHYTDAAHQLTGLLRHLSLSNGLNLKIEEISSGRKFNDRSKILDEFRAGNVDVLVCSDIYARGIDISEVRYVVLYSPPVHSRNYIHQVGRTARAGNTGTALTLVTENQVNPFLRMIKSMGSSNLMEEVVTERELIYLENNYKEALNSLKEETMKEKQLSDSQKKITRRENFKQIKKVRKNAAIKRKNITNGKRSRCRTRNKKL